MTTFVSFARRHNADSTMDSICTRCYQTVANALTENEFAEVEKNHVCDPNGEYSQHYIESQQGTF